MHCHADGSRLVHVSRLDSMCLDQHHAPLNPQVVDWFIKKTETREKTPESEERSGLRSENLFSTIR